MNILTANTSQKLIIQVTFFAAIVGGIMCDIKYGRYGTLTWFFPIYFVGQALITFSPLIPLPGFFHPYFDFFALFLLSYGCGCIKAVLAAYGADQFKPPNVTQIGCFFALFYSLEQFSIIFGIYLLPIIKFFFSQIPTDKPSLNVLSLATFLLLISIVILFGTSNYFYKFIPQNKNQNIFIKSFKIIKQSLINKYRRKPLITSTKQPKPKYLLEYFLIDHNCQRDRECDFGRKNICEQTKFIGELQTVIQISFVLLPLSIFWALRTKLISINISQIQNIDTKLPFIGPFLPSDQICCLLQPIFVILLLPLFYMFIFKSPSISQCLSLNTYLRRIFIGIFLCSVACFCSANIQKLLLSSNNNLLIKSTEDFTLIKLFNLFPSKCSFSISKINSKENFVIIEANNSNIFSLKSEDLTAGYVDLLFRFNGSSCSSHRKNLLRIWLNSATNNQFNIALVGPQGIFFTSLDIKNTKTNGPSNYLGFLNLLPCNSLSSSSFSSLPSECSNSTNDILTQALTPLKQSLSICDDSNNCPINWDLNEILSSTFFVFPPNGDNVGKGRGSVYSIKAIPSGKYQFSDLTPQTISTTTNSTINPPLLNISNNPLISLLPQNINVDGTGSIWLAVLSLDGSPLAGQNDSTTSSSLPNPIFTFLLLSGPPQLGILWLFPQNLLIAASEVLISVTGLEFCYMKSPTSFKATMLGYWYLIMYVGFSFVPIISKIQPFTDPFFQLLFCSFSLFNVALIFALIAYFYYNYRDNSSINGGFVENNQKQLLTEEIGGKFTEKLSGTLRASMARLPTKKVIRL
uniref:Uncharacterized protein n=1 Tax=Meloidogyne incognita TaxID=6306 RepID=A0A914LQE8_MELIC